MVMIFLKEDIMKRFLVLLLVLALVSTASATLKELRIAPGGTIASPSPTPGYGDYIEPVDSLVVMSPSDLLWIGIYNTTAGQAGDTGQDMMYLGMSGPGEWTGAYTMYSPPGVPNMLGNEYLGVIEGAEYMGDAWVCKITNGNPQSFMGVGVVDAKLFHCMGLGDVTVGLYSGEGDPVDSFIIHQIPEPMTMSLLALGGLFLRRRK